MNLSQISSMISDAERTQPFGNPSANVNVSTEKFRRVDLTTLNFSKISFNFLLKKSVKKFINKKLEMFTKPYENLNCN